MKILFVCNTLYQIIVACCIRKMFSEDKADIILSDHSVSNKTICERFKTTKLFFDNAYYVESKYLYEYERNLSRLERIKIVRDKPTVLSI